MGALPNTVRGTGSDAKGLELVVEGTVQGVGFRPFVHHLATSERLSGWVRNAADGVHICLFGQAARIARFRNRLASEMPPLARIAHIREQPLSGDPPEGFRIVASMTGDARTAVTADAATCAECRREMSDPGDRRFGYPFLNCTHCGPRFSIIEGLPYDRARTSMRRFAMCPACRAEYRDPGDRRFHAQPTACPDCGPAVWIEDAATGERTHTGPDAIEDARSRLRSGETVAIKGIGGFHLACSALDARAIGRLRTRKHRPAKPFAVMVRDLAVAERYCVLGAAEKRLLESPAAPIVLASMRADAELPDTLVPGLDRLGIMLPYAPLHILLMAPFDVPMVMTSGNAGDDPQVTDNAASRRELASFADALLMHDRDIVNRVDDSLVQIADGHPQVLRRARGYAPQPVRLPSGFGEDHPQILALGGDIKNTFAIAKTGNAILSQHIGDLTSATTHADLQSAISLYGDLFDFEPSLFVVDAHPDYRSARLARALAERAGRPLAEVQHHHAHAAACMAEHGLPRDHPPVLALVQDGIGWGEDGGLWGAELLHCDYRSARRLATLTPAHLPGGDLAARQPWRNLAARLCAAYGAGEDWPGAFSTRLADRPIDVLLRAVRAGVNAPLCSSAGRLFDAVSAAAGFCVDHQDYEGEAAMRLQAAAEGWIAENGPPVGYRFDLATNATGYMTVDPAGIWPEIADDLSCGDEPGRIAARFHVGYARAWAQTVRMASRDLERPPAVVLSGGVFQNRLLAAMVAADLASTGAVVLQHRDIPANDGGLALGQVVIALARHGSSSW